MQEGEEEDKSDDSITKEEIFSVVQQFRMVQERTGKDVCWNCCGSDPHCGCCCVLSV